MRAAEDRASLDEESMECGRQGIIAQRLETYHIQMNVADL